MILVQLVLILAFLVLLFKFVFNPGSYQMRASAKLFMLLFVVIAIVAIIFPNASNTVARWFGVTYGVDLLVYLLTVAFIFLVLHIYIKGKDDQKRLVQITRKLALLEAEYATQLPDHAKGHKGAKPE